MANLGNTTRPAYVYDAETDTWLPIGVGAHTHDQIPASIVDAKGDLIVGTAADTVQKRTVGADGSYLVADSTQTTGLNWAGPSNIAGKNLIINGGFDIWQRGTSSASSSVYLADRWYQIASGTTTHARDTDVPTGVPVQYSTSWTTGASSSYGQYYQMIEQDQVKALRGQTLTASFYIKTSGTSYFGNLILRIDYNTTSDTFAGGSWVGLSDNGFTGSSVTSWTRKTNTFTVPSNAVGIRFSLIPDTAQASGVIVKMTAAQLEVGSVATPFSRAAGTYQAELAACQRYYYRWTSGATYARYPTLGVAYSTTIGSFPAEIPVTMRVSPYSVEYGGNFRLYDMVNTPPNMTSIVLVGTTELSPTGWINIIVASGLTQLRTYSLNSRDDVNAYIGLNAEL
jgi:hypothetical protein